MEKRLIHCELTAATNNQTAENSPSRRRSARLSNAICSGEAAGRFLRGTMRPSTTINGFVVGMPGEFLDQGLDVPPLRLGQRTGLRHRPSLGPADPAVSVVSQNRTILFAKGLY